MRSKIDPEAADPAAEPGAGASVVPTTASISYHMPSQAVSGAITSYYLLEVTGPGIVRDQLFPEWTNFRLVLNGDWEAEFPERAREPVPAASITGTLERAPWAQGSAGLMVGVGLMPQGWPMLTDASADGFTDCLRPLNEAIGPAADSLHERLKAVDRAVEGDGAYLRILDEVFASLLTEAPEAALVAAAHVALQDPQVQTVKDWATAIDVSSRQLERFSQRYFGLSPKRLLRRQRLLRTLAALRDSGGGTMSQLIDAHFSDQAHFIHEFNYYMGTTPKAYLARPQPIMGEAWKRRKALLGAPVQLLQPPAGKE
jgi:AraC-like DNA-binding protein